MKYWTPEPSPVAESRQDFKVFSSLLPLQKALKVKHGDDPPKMHHTIKHKHWHAPAIWSRETVPLATGQTCYSLEVGILYTRSVWSSGGSRLQGRNHFLALERLPLAVSSQRAGGQPHNGIPGWMQSYLVCSGFERHSGTYSNRTYGTCRIHLSSRGLSQKWGLLGCVLPQQNGERSTSLRSTPMRSPLCCTSHSHWEERHQQVQFLGSHPPRCWPQETRPAKGWHNAGLWAAVCCPRGKACSVSPLYSCTPTLLPWATSSLPTCSRQQRHSRRHGEPDDLACAECWSLGPLGASS